LFPVFLNKDIDVNREEIILVRRLYHLAAGSKAEDTSHIQILLDAGAYIGITMK